MISGTGSTAAAVPPGADRRSRALVRRSPRCARRTSFSTAMARHAPSASRPRASPTTRSPGEPPQKPHPHRRRRTGKRGGQDDETAGMQRVDRGHRPPPLDRLITPIRPHRIPQRVTRWANSLDASQPQRRFPPSPGAPPAHARRALKPGPWHRFRFAFAVQALQWRALPTNQTDGWIFLHLGQRRPPTGAGGACRRRLRLCAEAGPRRCRPALHGLERRGGPPRCWGPP